MDTATPSFQVIKKPVRKNLKKTRSQNMKPAQIVIDDSGNDKHEYYCVYVSSGKQIKEPCTQDVYRRIRGPEPRKGRPHRGLDMQVGLEYLVAHDSKGTVVGLDIFPVQKYEHGMIPEELRGLELIEAVVNQTTGEVRVTAIPPKVSENTVIRIINGIDKLSEIHPHDMIDGKYEIMSVSGSTLQIAPWE